MHGLIGSYETYLTKSERLADQYDSIVTCEIPQPELKANGVPITVGIAMINIWSWVDPYTPYQQQIARNGGYFQNSLAVKRGTWK